MKNEKRLSIVSFLAFFSLIFIVFWPNKILAVAIKVTMDPVIKAYDLKPGEKITDVIYLKNQGASDVAVDLKLQQVSLAPNGQIAIKDEPAVVDWLNYQLEQSFILPAGEDQAIHFDLQVPKDLPQQTKEFALVAEVQPEAAKMATEEFKTQSQIKAQLACLFLLNIISQRAPGQLEITALSIVRPSDKETVQLKSLVTNTGPIYAVPQTVIELKNWQGKVVYRETLVPGVVLPQSSREFTWELPISNNWGRMTATVNSPDFQGGLVQESITFWLIPNWLKFTIIFLGIALVGVISFIILKLKAWRKKCEI